MRLVSFNALRSLGIPNVRYLKPELLFRERALLAGADWVLFPEYWQINALVYGFKARIFPSIASYQLGHDKIEMTRALWSVVPRHVPHTLILPSTASAIEQVLDEIGLPCVGKTVRSSMGQGVFLLQDRAALRDYAARHEVLYLQELLPARRDLRVVWVGNGVLTAYWRVGAEGAFHNNLAQGGRICFDAVPPQPIALAADAAGALGIDHAGFDLMEVDGHWYFLEFNTLFGNQALNARGIDLGAAILSYLDPQRLTPPRAPAPLSSAA